MLYAGLDLSRIRLDFHLLEADGATVEVGMAPPDVDGLGGLTQRLARHGEPIRAAIASMNGARFVHDRLELHGWQVEIADAQKVKGLAPLACKTDRIDAWVLAELARRDLVPAIWLPDPQVRAERERARWRLHLVRHRSSLKQRVHAVLLTHGKPCPVSDLFGVRGFAGFVKETHTAVVVLSNCSRSVDAIGFRILEAINQSESAGTRAPQG